MRRFVLAAVLFTITSGCAKRKLGYRDSGPDLHGGFRGIYLTAPEEWIKLRGKGYAEIRMLPLSHVQILLRHWAYPKIIWRFIGKGTRTSLHQMKVTCNHVAALWNEDGAAPQLLFSKSKGKRATPVVPDPIASVFQNYQLNSDLRDHLPTEVTACDGRNLVLTRHIEEGRSGGSIGLTLTDENRSMRFTDIFSKGFRGAIDELPVSKVDFPNWGLKNVFEPLNPASVVEHPYNAILPAPQAQRFFLLHKPKMAASKLSPEGIATIGWTRAERLNLRKFSLREHKIQIDPLSYSRIEIGNWESPVPTTVRVARIVDPADFFHVPIPVAKTREEEGEWTVDLSSVFSKADRTTPSLEIAFGYPDVKIGSTQGTIWQTYHLQYLESGVSLDTAYVSWSADGTPPASSQD